MTEAVKIKTWKRIQAQRDKFMGQVTAMTLRALDRQIQPLLDAISPSTWEDIPAKIQALVTEEEIQKVYQEIYSLVLPYFASQTYREIKKSTLPALILKDLPTDEEWIQDVTGELADWGGDRITSITGSSRDKALRIVNQSLQNIRKEGLGASQAAQMLRDDLRAGWGNIGLYRASRIARTEIAAASNLGSLKGALKTEEPLFKVWLSTRDSRTRRPKKGMRFDHYGTYPHGPDGEKRDLDKPFMKTGEALDHPGDPALGSAANVIHCRCTMYYDPKVQDEAGGEEEVTAIPEEEIQPARPAPRPRPARAVDVDTRIKTFKKEIKKTESLQAQAEIHKKEADKWATKLQIKNAEFKAQRGVIRDPETRRLAYEEYKKEAQMYLDNYHKSIREYQAALKPIQETVTSLLEAGSSANFEITFTAQGASTNKNLKPGMDYFKRIVGERSALQGRTARTNVTKKGIRCYYSQGVCHYSNTEVTGVETICHELGHWLEHSDDAYFRGVEDFFRKRAGDEKIKSLRSFVKGSHYSYDEVFIEDKFKEPYCGKVYGTVKKPGTYRMAPRAGDTMDEVVMRSSEITSMWFTQVMENPSKFVAEDPDYFETIFRLLNEGH